MDEIFYIKRNAQGYYINYEGSSRSLDKELCRFIDMEYHNYCWIVEKHGAYLSQSDGEWYFKILSDVESILEYIEAYYTMTLLSRQNV